MLAVKAGTEKQHDQERSSEEEIDKPTPKLRELTKGLESIRDNRCCKILFPTTFETCIVRGPSLGCTLTAWALVSFVDVPHYRRQYFEKIVA